MDAASSFAWDVFSSFEIFGPLILLWAMYRSFGDETSKGLFPCDRFDRYNHCDRWQKPLAVVAIIWKTFISDRCEML